MKLSGSGRLLKGEERRGDCINTVHIHENQKKKVNKKKTGVAGQVSSNRHDFLPSEQTFSPGRVLLLTENMWVLLSQPQGSYAMLAVIVYQVRALGRLISCFPPSKACIEVSSNIKASSQEIGCHIRPISGVFRLCV